MKTLYANIKKPCFLHFCRNKNERFMQQPYIQHLK